MHMTIRCSPSSTPTITPRLDVHDGGQADHGTSTCSGRIDGSESLIRAIWENIMDREWNDSQPFTASFRDRVVAMILDGVLKEAIPSPLCAMSRRNIGSNHSRSEGLSTTGRRAIGREQERSRDVHQRGRAQSAAAGRAAEVSAEEWARVRRPSAARPENRRTAEWVHHNPAGPTQTAEEKPKP